MTVRSNPIKERRSVALDDDPLLGPLGAKDGDNDQASEIAAQTSYFDLTRRTAEAVERVHNGKASQSLGSTREGSLRPRGHSQSGSLPQEGTSPGATASSSSPHRSLNSGRSEAVEGDGATGGLSPSPETPMPNQQGARAVSMVLIDGGAKAEEDDAAERSSPLILLESLHKMTDRELERHTGSGLGSAMALVRAASRALADSQDELRNFRQDIEGELASTKAELQGLRSTSAAREQALVGLCKTHGAGDGEIERALARVSKQETVGQKIAGQQKMLGQSLQEAMDDSLGEENIVSFDEQQEEAEKARPVIIDATLRRRPGASSAVLPSDGSGTPGAPSIITNSSKSHASSISSRAKRSRRPRSDSIASTSAVSDATSSRKTEGTGLTDWASSLMPWGSGSKKAPPSISPTSPDGVASGEMSVGEMSTDDEGEAGSTISRSRRTSVAFSRRREPSVSSQVSASPSTHASRRARHTSRTLSIFGGLAWRRGAKAGPDNDDTAGSVNGDDSDDEVESFNASGIDTSLASPAVRGLRAASGDQAGSRARLRSAGDEDGEGTIRIKASPHDQVLLGDGTGSLLVRDSPTLRQGKTPGRTSAADALRFRGGDVTPVKGITRTPSASSTRKVPNVTRVPQIYGNASADPDLPLMPAPVKTMELKAMVPKDARPPTLAATRLEDGEAPVKYEAGSDPFEVYGGLTQALKASINSRSLVDNTLTDRYGFMYAATPADLRLLRQAKEASTTAPACLAGTRAESVVDSEEDAASNHGSDISPRPSFSRASSFLARHAEKAKASTQASSISVSAHSIEDEKVERKDTVKSLLKQLDEMYDEQQAEQRVKWDVYLEERKGKMQTMRRRPKGSFDPEDEAAITSLDNTLNLVGIAQMGTSKSGREDWRHFLKLCLAGVPLAYRSQIWAECSGANEIAEPGQYDELLSEHVGEENQCLAQIDLDVHRTMPTNVFFGGDGPGVPKLRRVLAAFSWYDVEIGYCQGELKRLICSPNLCADNLACYHSHEQHRCDAASHRPERREELLASRMPYREDHAKGLLHLTPSHFSSRPARAGGVRGRAAPYPLGSFARSRHRPAGSDICLVPLALYRLPARRSALPRLGSALRRGHGDALPRRDCDSPDAREGAPRRRHARGFLQPHASHYGETVQRGQACAGCVGAEGSDQTGEHYTAAARAR